LLAKPSNDTRWPATTDNRKPLTHSTASIAPISRVGLVEIHQSGDCSRSIASIPLSLGNPFEVSDFVDIGGHQGRVVRL